MSDKSLMGETTAGATTVVFLRNALPPLGEAPLYEGEDHAGSLQINQTKYKY
jgi:hypothetical protein